MITNRGITVVITVTDSEGVTNLHHYKEFSSRELKVGKGVRFRFRILTNLLVVVSLLDEVNPPRGCLHFPASVHLDELLSFLWGLHRTYDQARRKFKGV